MKRIVVVAAFWTCKIPRFLSLTKGNEGSFCSTSTWNPFWRRSEDLCLLHSHVRDALT